MALDTQNVQELQAMLLQEKTRLEKELSHIANPTENPGDYETRFEDIGREEGDNPLEVEQYVDNLAVETNLEQQLQDVLAALERIDKGSYGICDQCGKDISVARLKAYPSATMCVEH